MKHQYFGDENDYRKYGLLRGLTGLGELSSFICWMLTSDDGSTDGRFTDYLRSPSGWRAHDQELFDALHNAVVIAGRRTVQICAETDLLPGARFHTRLLTNDAKERDRYFEEVASASEGSDLVFFDPDNGLEVASCRRGAVGSVKYLYWSELSDAFARDQSVLVYQHFPRERRDRFITRIAQHAGSLLDVDSVHTFSTTRVLFLLIPHSRHAALLRQRSHDVARRWAGQIAHAEHRLRAD